MDGNDENWDADTKRRGQGKDHGTSDTNSETPGSGNFFFKQFLAGVAREIGKQVVALIFGCITGDPATAE